jgi:hypothetical protein
MFARSLLFWCALALPSTAASLPIAGDWGDLSGCEYTNGGEGYDIDDMMLLRADWISGYVFSCEIAAVQTVASGMHLVSGICHQEGFDDAYSTRAFVLKPRQSEKAIEIFFEDGTKWGEVRPC